MASSIQQPEEPSLEAKIEPSPSPSPSPSRQLIPMATASLTPTADSDSTDYDTTPIPMAIPMGVPIAGILPPVRRLPPPCWTPDETSVLIDAYRDIWFSLRRANLRANHWQDVADTIHSHCPDVLPPKTAVQCRHKMEKLRKRYRAELLRAKSIPHHRFSSSWVYFSKMDSIDKSPDTIIHSSSAATLPSPQPLSSVPFAASSHDDHLTPRTYSQPRPTPYPAHRFPTPPSHSHRPPPTFAPDFDDSPSPHPTTYAFNNNNNNNNNNYAAAAAAPSKPGYASNYGTPHYNNNPSRFVNTHDDNNAMGLEMDYVNAATSKKKRKMMSNGGEGGVEKRDKEDHSGGLQMVQAIRMLGESFLNMEKMKMDMMRETERLRMEMEMKRTQMLLDSQHRIIQAFTKGCSDVIINNNDDHHTAS